MPSRRINQLLVRLILFRLYLPLLIVGVLAILDLGYHSAKNQVNHQSQATRSLAQLVEYHLDQGERILRGLANAIHGYDRRETADLLKSIWSTNGYFETLYYLDGQNRVSVLMPEDSHYLDLDLSNVPGIRESENERKFVISPPYLSVRTGEPVVLLIQNLPSAGKIVGELKLGLLQKEILNSQKQSDIDFLFIADQNGTVLASPDVKAVNERNNISDLAPFRMGNRNTGALIYTYAGALVLGVSTQVDRTGWVIVDQVTLSRFSRTYAWTIGQILLVSSAIWALLRWGLRKQLEQKVSRPMEELSRQTNAMTEGDAQVVESYPKPGSSFLELDKLASDFTIMISRLQAREKALRASEFRYRSLFESAQDGILILDAELGIIVDVNPLLLRWWGDSNEEILGKKVWDLDFFRNIIPGQSQFEDLKEKGYTHYEGRILGTASGQFIEVEFVSQVLQVNEQQVIQCNFRDISERRQAEEQQRQLQAQLQQTQKMESLGSLAGGVAHDMNNVLGAILVTASANIEAHPEGSPAYRAFETISRAAVRGGQMVKSLLSLARQNPAKNQELDMNEILREEVRLLERTTLSKVRLEMDLACDLRPTRGDASALAHAFMNLCVNAVDAMPDNGTLTLRTRNVDNEWIEVQVLDTGSGMTKEVLDKAVDPFFTTKDVGKGTGLGLSMVFSTVKAHQGKMEIQSEPGHGTCVRLCFPASQVVVQVPETATEPSSRSSRGALNVLLVDDDELIRSALQALLKALGHTTTAVSSGEEALVRLEAGFQPDVVILDMNMPGLGGVGTLPRLRVQRPTVPVLLATGRVDQTALDLVEAHPNVILLSKPFSKRELQQQLESIRLSRVGDRMERVL
jgi:PAS domain S-box-containing protein